MQCSDAVITASVVVNRTALCLLIVMEVAPFISFQYAIGVRRTNRFSHLINR